MTEHAPDGQAADSGADSILLPEQSRVLHIGPHKTGTTALQAALHAARQSMRRQGLEYASRGRHEASSVHAALGLPSPWSSRREPPPRWLWRRLLWEIRRSRATRVLLSSEFFADGSSDAIRRVVDELDPERVQVVVTLRPLAKIIPSQWQQWVQNQLTTPFDDWLASLLHDPPSANPLFWRRHRHDELIRRWIDVVGSDRLLVVVLDQGDPDQVFRVFERLTGLATGTLQPVADYANRSLTVPEIELIRAINIAMADQGLAKTEYNRIMRFGAAQLMKRRAPRDDEPRLELPDWSLEPIAAIERSIVDAIRESRVRVLGDLESLAAVPVGRTGGLDGVMVRPEVAASAAVGVLVATGVARGSADMAVVVDSDPEAEGLPRAPRKVQEPPELLRLASRQIAVVLARRARGRLREMGSSLFRRTTG